MRDDFFPSIVVMTKHAIAEVTVDMITADKYPLMMSSIFIVLTFSKSDFIDLKSCPFLKTSLLAIGVYLLTRHLFHAPTVLHHVQEEIILFTAICLVQMDTLAFYVDNALDR